MQMKIPQMLDPELVRQTPVKRAQLRDRTDVGLLRFADKLRMVISSIMRWRSGEIGLFIGKLLSTGLHTRAILADRWPAYR